MLLLLGSAGGACAQLQPGAPATPAAPTTAEARAGTPARGAAAFDCGDLAYDDGVAETSIFFGGGQAGEPDHFLGVRFELDDFDLEAGRVLLTGFCISNSLDFSAVGGPWPNEVYVYRDIDGEPDLGDPQRNATVITGDGTGQVEITFESPWIVDDPVFWIMVQGDPRHAGEDFNVESDQSLKPAGRSWIADRGVAFMIPTRQDFMLRATVEVLAGSAATVPALGVAGLLALAAVVLLLGLAARRRLDARGS
ncbi:hypothetical protein [Halomonas denitrificans]|nr:hypothetical protein [Halomonas denitrificans]